MAQLEVSSHNLEFSLSKHRVSEFVILYDSSDREVKVDIVAAVEKARKVVPILEWTTTPSKLSKREELTQQTK
jgi:hypothetical protein